MTVTRDRFATYREICSQAQTLKEVLLAHGKPPLNLQDFSEILFVGCGSSLFLGQAVSESWQRVSARAVPSSEILLRPDRFQGRKETCRLVFPISRSGETTETVKAAAILAEQPDTTLCPVTCEPDSSLARLGSTSLIFKEAAEESVVMTRAFTAILGAFLAWEGHLEELKRLVPGIQNSLEANQEKMAQMARNDYRNVIFLGTGSLYPLAKESTLKLKEMTGEVTEAWQTFEFRHGPRAVLDNGSLVWLYAARAEMSYLADAISEFNELGARCLVVGCDLTDSVRDQAEWVLDFHWALEESSLQGVGLIHLAQLYAFFRAVHLKRDPDRPPKLSRVVKL